LLEKYLAKNDRANPGPERAMKAGKPVCPYCDKSFDPLHANVVGEATTTGAESSLIPATANNAPTAVNTGVKITPIISGLTVKRMRRRIPSRTGKQRRRNQKRKIALIVKNNLALDVKRLPAEVWWRAGGGHDCKEQFSFSGSVYIACSWRFQGLTLS
jgi:hypothetical protein